MNKIMARMHENLQRLFGFSSNPMDTNGFDDRKELDALEPICKTTINPRRKKYRQTQTTTCTKELILHGKKQSYKEINITDTQGRLLSQSKIYQSIILNNNTIPIDNNVISY